jgi:hypothetical protein
MLALVLATALASPLSSWNEERRSTQRVGMFALGGWAVGNLGVGAFGVALEPDERLRALHLGNLVWNGVNLALAVIGLIDSWRPEEGPLDAKALLVRSEREEKVFFINAALDVAYLATAAFLWQRGDATGDPRLVGFGQALLIQGGFLLAFDTVMGLLNLRLTGRLLEQVSVTPLGVSGTF